MPGAHRAAREMQPGTGDGHRARVLVSETGAGNGFVIVTPTGVQVVETSAAIDDVTEERPWGAHADHYISNMFQTAANSAGESVQRLEEAAATLCSSG